jgi:5-methylcytosine-specific restriction endonuclease McrA
MADGIVTPSKACGQCGKAIKIRRICNACHLKEYKKAHPERVARYRALESAKAKLTTRQQRPCLDCHIEFVTSPAKRCSSCVKARVKYKTFIRNSKLHQAPARACKECGLMFTPAYGVKRRTYCSDGCCSRATKRTARLKGKAKKRSLTIESVNPFKVFERDGWRCHLCGCKTPKEKRGTYHPKAPELDHIVPLSKGGEHSYRNTACACRACNAAKSDRIIGQPSLLAA